MESARERFPTGTRADRRERQQIGEEKRGRGKERNRERERSRGEGREAKRQERVGGGGREEDGTAREPTRNNLR